MTSLLDVQIEDDEGEGQFHLVVYPSINGNIEVTEPVDVRPDFEYNECSMKRCLSNRQRYRLYENLRVLFEMVEKPVAYLTLSPDIYKTYFEDSDILETVLCANNDEEACEESGNFPMWEEG